MIFSCAISKSAICVIYRLLFLMSSIILGNLQLYQNSTLTQQDHWPHPRPWADNGKLHWASCRQCEKPAVITHAFPRFHSTPCGSSSSSQQSDQLGPQSSCWGGDMLRPCNYPSIHSLTGPVSQPFASPLGGQCFASWGCTNSQWNWVSPVNPVLLQFHIFYIF